MALVSGVYDHVPQDAAFPYLSLGDETSTPDDTDDITGADLSFAVHTWSRYRGQKEVQDIQHEVWSALHRSNLTVEGAAFVGCHLESTQPTTLDPDGITHHGVQLFRVLLFEVTP